MQIIDNTNKQEFGITELTPGEVYKIKDTNEFVLAVDHFYLEDGDNTCVCYAVDLSGCGLYATPCDKDKKFIPQNAKIVIE